MEIFTDVFTEIEDQFSDPNSSQIVTSMYIRREKQKHVGFFFERIVLVILNRISTACFCRNHQLSLLMNLYRLIFLPLHCLHQLPISSRATLIVSMICLPFLRNTASYCFYSSKCGRY